MAKPADNVTISLTVNGEKYSAAIESRQTLADFLREERGLKGTHLGCEQGVCGACTVLLNGRAVRSCLVLAAQADGCEVTTVEGLESQDGTLHPLQEAFWDEHGFQCGFCTPGMMLTAYELLGENPDPSEEEIRVGLSGTLCRCTGYQDIVTSVQEAARRMRDAAPSPASD